jgi:hypothetical protein
VPGGTGYFVRNFKPFCFGCLKVNVNNRLDLISAGIVLVLTESIKSSHVTPQIDSGGWVNYLVRQEGP